MQLKKLRYFIAVADAGSFTAAAGAIPIAQPALTRQIRELEEEMGVLLLQRLPRGVRLTPAGVTFYESARRILAEANQLTQRLARTQDSIREPVVLGAPPTLSQILLPRIFDICTDTHNGIALRIREAFTPGLLEWLEKGIIDIAIVTNPEPGRALSFQPLLGEPFILASDPQMRLGPVLSVAQLASIPLIMTSLHRSIVSRQLASVGKELSVHAEIDSVETIRELVLRGKWATIMPVSTFKGTQQARDIVLSEISGVQLNRLLVLATRLDSKSTASLALVHELVISEFSRLERQGLFRLGVAE